MEEEKGSKLSGDYTTKINKYAFACSVVASVISIIFGYGNNQLPLRFLLFLMLFLLIVLVIFG